MKYHLKLLQKLMGKKNVLTEYKDLRYPFHCDIYLKNYDLFIEVNLFPGYMQKWFNPKNKNHIKIANKLSKSIRTFDKSCFKTWTISDYEKRKTAKKNKLNYLVFWNSKSIYEWYNKIKKDKTILKKITYKDYLL